MNVNHSYLICVSLYEMPTGFGSIQLRNEQWVIVYHKENQIKLANFEMCLTEPKSHSCISCTYFNIV